MIFENKKPPTKKRLKVLLVHSIDLLSNQLLEFFQNLVDDFENKKPPTKKG
jgi:hypothetical protein